MISKLKILDLSTVLAGPSVGTFFAELGAEVTKIENTNIPDVTRSWKSSNEDKNSNVSAYFSSVNYKKKYVQLNLKEESDRFEFFELLKDTDILLSNFKKGDQEKLGIPDSKIFQFNPKLIHGKINGFGSDSDRVAYDLILQAETGIMSMNGTPESGPVKMPIAFIDILAAHHLKEGILISLLQKDSIKNGRVVEVSLYEAAIASLANQASNYLMNNFVPKAIGSLHPNIAPYGEIFKTSDGKLMTFAIGSNKHFQIFCEFLNLHELITNDKYSSNQNRVINRIELFDILEQKIKHFDSKEIYEYMNKHFVPCAIIKQLDKVFEDKSAQQMILSETIENVETKRVSSIAFRMK